MKHIVQKKRSHRRAGAGAHCLAGLAAVLSLSAGCLTTPDPAAPGGREDASVPLTRSEIQSFYSRAKDPREFWITVYASRNGPVFKGDHRTHPNQLQELPFLTKEKTNLPVIQTQTGRLHLHPFLIDTTSAESWVALETAAAMKLTPLGMPAYSAKPVHVKDDSPGYLCVAPTLRAELLHVESVLMFARGASGPLGPLARRVNDPVPAGVLGTRFIEAFSYVQFDFPEHKLVLASTEVYKPDAKRLLATAPFSVVDGYLTVEGDVDERRGTILIDTAGDYTLLVPDKEGTLVRELRIADLHVENVTVSPNDDPRLALTDQVRVGLKILSRYKVTLDVQQRVIHFEQAPP